MGKRNTSRRLAMQALYQMEAGEIDSDEALKFVFSETDFPGATKDFAGRLLKGALEAEDEIDGYIKKLSKDWSFERISKVDKSILRLALYELLKEKQVPVNVVIDEAVELAKRYSTLEAAKFINGILGAFVREAQKIS